MPAAAMPEALPVPAVTPPRPRRGRPAPAATPLHRHDRRVWHRRRCQHGLDRRRTSGDTTGTGDTTGGRPVRGTRPAPTGTGGTSGDGGTTIGAGTGGTSGDTGGSGDTSAPDEDGDGIADSDDNCPAIANADQADSDTDGLGNVCDPTPNGDDDADGVDDMTDNCPGLANPDQTDTDGDRLGDACDPTPNGDRDGDGVDDTLDNCPDMANGSQTDTDGDGLGDACDPTPNGDPVAHFYNVAANGGGTDAAGHSWQGIGTEGFTADRRVRIAHPVKFGGTNDDFIYERMAYSTSGDLHWSTSGLPDGTYTVRLYLRMTTPAAPAGSTSTCRAARWKSTTSARWKQAAGQPGRERDPERRDRQWRHADPGPDPGGQCAADQRDRHHQLSPLITRRGERAAPVTQPEPPASFSSRPHPGCSMLSLEKI